MDYFVQSTDDLKIHYTQTNSKNTDVALVFVHGWLGHADWWLDQEEFFKQQYNIVRIDLAGHGQSEHHRSEWTHTLYAQDIASVIKHLNSKRVILIGHSMAGAYVLEALHYTDRVKAIVLIDTLKDLEQVFTFEQAEQTLFKQYKENYEFAVRNIIPQYLFTQETPKHVQVRLENEFLSYTAESAIVLLAPLYKMDVQKAAKLVNVKVRAINSDASPTHLKNNKKYFQDYDFKTITGTGHYPMLEKPDEFNHLLKEVVDKLLID